jgi:hypothetical protein
MWDFKCFHFVWVFPGSLAGPAHCPARSEWLDPAKETRRNN